MAQGERVVLAGKGGTAYERDGQGRRFVRLDSGNSGWFREIDLALSEAEVVASKTWPPEVEVKQA